MSFERKEEGIYGVIIIFKKKKKEVITYMIINKFI
jgi:hypothetical protein